MNTMIRVCILSGRTNTRAAQPFKDGDVYGPCYEYMSQLARERGVTLYYVGYKWYDPKKVRFSHGWTYIDGRWRLEKKVRPNVIYDKTVSDSSLRLPNMLQQMQRDVPVINDPEFTLLVDNKFFSSLLFPEYSKTYHRVTSTRQLKDVLKKLKGSRVVIKTEHGSGGHAVQILSRKLASAVSVSEPVIVQEFINSSAGIPGVVQGYHDLRLTYINDRFIYAYVRTPAKGSLLANVSQGGAMEIADPTLLPASVWKLADTVLERLHYFSPKVFAIDVIMDSQQKPWMVELTSKPGVYFDPHQKKTQRAFYIALINEYKKAAR